MSFKQTCRCVKCGGEFPRAHMARKRDDHCRKCSASVSLSIAGRGNLARTTNPWRTFSKRLAAKPEQKWAVTLAERIAAELMADKPNPTAAEVALIRGFAVAQACLLMAAGDIGERGAFDDEGQARNALRELPRYLAECRQTLALLGLERRIKDMPRLADVLSVKATESKP